MSDHVGFLKAIVDDPDDQTRWLVYADWLEDRGDVRAEFLRLRHALKSLAPDHLHRVPGEHELSRLRKDMDPTWLAIIEPEHAPQSGSPGLRGVCACFDRQNGRWKEMAFHTETQDTESRGWKRLLDLVEQAAADGRDEFAPRREMDPVEWSQIKTLPPTIAKLKSVKRLMLYGSHLVRIPLEIGEMSSLEEFTPYTSYRLHWFPYEITRCPNLRRSTISTRALYGNYKNRPPFPRLKTKSPGPAENTQPEGLPFKHREPGSIRNCSVCNRPFEDRRRYRVWISLNVATDVVPLLVNACSMDCVGRLPAPAEGYVPRAHTGGKEVQPPRPR